MSEIPANYFDGQRAKGYAVTVAVRDRHVIVTGDGVARREPLEAVEISDALGVSPRFVRFSDGAFCEVNDHDALDRLVRETGVRQGLVARWEAGRLWIGASALLIVIVALGYQYGLPVVAKLAADRLPPSALERLGTHVLAALDSTVLTPSDVPIESQTRIIEAFDRLRLPPASSLRPHIAFRKSAAIGANALALPSGDIIVTDGLVALARNDSEVLGVLAHEAGHVNRRHGARLLLQNSFVALFATWYVGDVSTLLAAAPVVLLQAKYSRDFEREADAYGAEVLRQSGISPGSLADLLERLEAAHAGSEQRGLSIGYLSTHPATAERLKRLRGR